MEFGPFRMDEPGRALRLAGRELDLQPRVFDLLAHLVRHRDRVVSKGELLDALWPGVTVTENSLQRAVSTLRTTLRAGGMESILKNYPGKGYRFCAEVAEAESVRAERGESLALAKAHRRAFAEQRWSDVASFYSGLEGADALSGGELEEWGTALQCLGRPGDAIPVFVRAISAHKAAGEQGAAARLAISLSTIHMERNEMAPAKGWVANARDWLAATPDAPETGLVLWMRAKITAADGDLAGALELADAAYNFGQRKGEGVVEALGLMYRGFYKVSLGETEAGLADQDRAAALALCQNVGAVTGSILYCNILWTCRAFADWARAQQWTLGYRQFCRDSRMEFSGSCQLHYAEVLGVQGSLPGALAHIEDAIAHLETDSPWALGDAYRVQGDLFSALGQHEEAISAYERSYGLGWSPEPGYAMLLLERGQAEAAYESLERSLTGLGWWNMQRRGLLLAHVALVAARTGRAERAEAIIAELSGHQERWPMPSVRALASEASAALAERRGEAREALRRLQLSRQLWTSVSCRLNATRLRLTIASLQLSLGDRTGAGVELRAASATARELESDKLASRCRQMEEMLA